MIHPDDKFTGDIMRKPTASGILEGVLAPEADFGVVSNTDKYDIPGN